MLLKTQQLFNEFWNHISTTEHGWQNLRHFNEWAEDQVEVNSFADESWLTKEFEDLPFGPDNCLLINVWGNSDYNKILRGAYRLGGNTNEE